MLCLKEYSLEVRVLVEQLLALLVFPVVLHELEELSLVFKLRLLLPHIDKFQALSLQLDFQLLLLLKLFEELFELLAILYAKSWFLEVNVRQCVLLKTPESYSKAGNHILKLHSLVETRSGQQTRLENVSIASQGELLLYFILVRVLDVIRIKMQTLNIWIDDIHIVEHILNISLVHSL